ncbi:MlaE family lipid ABC transporter permease subunit [Rhodomicrobium sp. Az07]|uniref:MlaE family lipid ABC transporter permease subunit n=1 Tax=Rhodomicrobium sp. Az07 TaxID=2839034 RepID=UPI001BE9A40A|nr:MlaE family lipid ABC transporter permease subunit [Rhodomicrobium sp. Az07]MBT3071183.1 MlaE family lipid ABC transporter permease subunit [Rhodomicrobium sp. Az07]
MHDNEAVLDRSTRPALRSAEERGTRRLVVSGDWTLATLREAQAAVDGVEAPNGPAHEIDIGDMRRLDTAGALTLVGLRDGKSAAATADFSSARAEHRILLDEIARAAPASFEPPPPRAGAAVETLRRFLSAATAIGRDAVRLTMFLGETTAALGRVVARPKRFRVKAFTHQLQQTGLSAVPIIALVSFLIGGVVMQQAAFQLQKFGAETMSIDMLGILALRELGVILAAVMVAGRSASAFTAQIGTMKMREEIDAMRTLGIDPIETLVLPRVLALMIALPLLVFLADVMALAGGAVMAKLYLSLDTEMYLQRLNSAVQAKHLYVGLIKAPFAALVIGLVGCLEGLSVRGSAESVGTQVTTAVVKAIFLVLVLDAVFAIFLSAAGF